MSMRLTSRGDTIVEVLIAIAVVSLVLGGAYVTSNRSLKAVRQAQEHTEALKYAESQLEQLRSVASSDPTIFTQTHIFCMNNGSPASPTDANSPGIAMNNSVPTNGYSPACKTSTPVSYNKAITCMTDPVLLTPCPSVPVPASGSYVFTVHINWDGIQGGTDQVSISYRLDY